MNEIRNYVYFVSGNIFVIAAILLERNLQSVANYLILSLAVADLLVACLVMPLGKCSFSLLFLIIYLTFYYSFFLLFLKQKYQFFKFYVVNSGMSFLAFGRKMFTARFTRDSITFYILDARFTMNEVLGISSFGVY